MSFSSVFFIFFFLPIFLLVYFIIPKKFKNITIVLFSVLFYTFGEIKYCYVMFISTIIDFVCGQLIYKYQHKKVIFLLISIISNLGILFFFKYTNFFIDSINCIFRYNIPYLDIYLPLGISFYTFQTLSYTIDVYRNKVKPTNNIIDFVAYVTMFPQLIAGPIVKYITIEKQLKNKKISLLRFNYGLRRFIKGLAKKVILADGLTLVFMDLININPSSLSVVGTFLISLVFLFKIYYDFSGYSDMAIGMGRMLGFKLLENFNYPGDSKTVSEIYRRWNISVMTWFKEYVFIPLGGSRNGKLVTVRNLLITWALTGIWHGNSVNFILWGLLTGTVIILENTILKKFIEKHKIIYRFLCAWPIAMLITLFFAFSDIGVIFIYIKNYFKIWNFIDTNTIYILKTNLILIFICLLGFTSNFKVFILGYSETKMFKVCENLFYVILFIISTAYLVNNTYNAFIYFRF